MLVQDKIYIAGHTGLVGSAVTYHLQKRGFTNLCYRTHQELDLTNQKCVFDFISKEQPKYIFLCAAKVGGINANNTYPGVFDYAILSSMLVDVGFTNVHLYDWKHTIHKYYDDYSQAYYPHMDKEHGKLISLNLECLK